MAASSNSEPRPSMLIINPNSTQSMTDALKPLVASLGPTTWSHTYLTAPPSPLTPTSINNAADAAASTAALIPHLSPSLLARHDAFLVACYSAHPLVPWLRRQPAVRDAGARVLGIMEASVLAAVGVVGAGGTDEEEEAEAPRRFGVVTTGAAWVPLLTEAVGAFLGGGGDALFAGVESTGLDAAQLHAVEAGEVRRRLKAATGRLLGRGDVGAVCLGCAGMVGLDAVVREACVEVLGQEEGRRVVIVDGVLAGVGWLEGMWRMKGAMAG